jgi:Concanavalin A-like lectin/glucanases superfamily
MPIKTVKEIYRNLPTGEVTVEYSDDTVRTFLQSDTVASEVDANGNVTGLLASMGAIVPVVPAAARTRVLVIGSSNAYGVGASSIANSWVGLLTSSLASTHDFFNIAIGGKAASYWVNEDAFSTTITTSGTKCNLELALDTYKPHIVIGALVTQNGIDVANQATSYIQANSNAFISYVLKAKGICERRGVRYIGVAPYGSNAFTAKNWSAVRAIGEQLDAKGVTLLDFFNVSYQGGVTIPAAIDSGDGLHYNDLGHLQQFKAVPQSCLKLTTSELSATLRFPASTEGLVFPSDITTLSPLLTDAFPSGSFTVGFRIKAPATPIVATALSFTGDNNLTRVRSANPLFWEVAGSTTLQNTPTFAGNGEQHITLVFNQVLSTMQLYIDGIFASTNATTGANTFTGLILGGRYDNAAFNPVAYKFRDVTIHAAPLNARNIKLLAGGDIPLRSLYAAYPLVDGFTRSIGDSFSNLYGDVSLNSSITIV